MRAKLVIPAAAAAWMLSLAAPHPARADLPIKPLDSKDQFSVSSDPYVPDNRDPRRILAVPDQQVAGDRDRAARIERVLKVYLFWERFFRVVRIGGVAR